MSSPQPPPPRRPVPEPSPQDPARPELPPVFIPAPADAAELPPLRVDYAAVTLPGRRWWWPLLSLLIVVGAFLICLVVIFTGVAIYGLVAHQDPAYVLTEFEGGRMGPVLLLSNNLLLASLIPCVILALWLAHRVRPGFAHSVAGRFRWKWFGEITLVLLPLWLLYIGLRSGWEGISLQVHPQIVVLLVIILLTQPLQCAGEEYAFRGWFFHNLGGLFSHPAVRWAVPILPSSLLFALLHGSMDIWIIADLAIFATAAALMTWRTGGLEAAVALHMLNNMILMSWTLVFGGFDAAFVSESSAGTAIGAGLTLLGHAIAVALVWWWAARRGVQRLTDRDPRIPRRRPPVPMVAVPVR